jgi:hypothetical protein
MLPVRVCHRANRINGLLQHKYILCREKHLLYKKWIQKNHAKGNVIILKIS